jgi:hypothetical protein
MNMRGMGCALYIRCALSIHQKKCRKRLGCALCIGARYLPENTVYIYIHMELLVKPEILTSYIYEPTFGNAERRLFLFAAQYFNPESMQ